MITSGMALVVTCTPLVDHCNDHLVKRGDKLLHILTIMSRAKICKFVPALCAVQGERQESILAVFLVVKCYTL